MYVIMNFFRNQRNMLITALIAGTVFSTGLSEVSVANAKEASDYKTAVCGMPNPVIEYESIESAEKELGISALKVDNPEFKLNRVSVISNRLIELEYININDDKLTITTRTAINEYVDSITAEADNKNISGIYGAKWYDENIGDVYIREANLDNNISVGYWNDNKCSYSVCITNTTPREFWNLTVPIYQTIFPEI